MLQNVLYQLFPCSPHDYKGQLTNVVSFVKTTETKRLMIKCLRVYLHIKDFKKQDCVFKKPMGT